MDVNPELEHSSDGQGGGGGGYAALAAAAAEVGGPELAGNTVPIFQPPPPDAGVSPRVRQLLSEMQLPHVQRQLLELVHATAGNIGNQAAKRQRLAGSCGLVDGSLVAAAAESTAGLRPGVAAASAEAAFGRVLMAAEVFEAFGETHAATETLLARELEQVHFSPSAGKIGTFVLTNVCTDRPG